MAGTIGSDSQRSGPPDPQSGGGNTTYDGTYVSVDSPSQATVVIRNGRIVSFKEEAAGGCELAIQADFVISPPTGEFSGNYTGSVSSGPAWCVPTNGTMSGRVDGAQMTMTYTNATSGASFNLQLVRFIAAFIGAPGLGSCFHPDRTPPLVERVGSGGLVG